MRSLARFTDDPKLVEAFVELPYTLHGESALWIPPIRESVRQQLSPRNPYFRHGKAQHFLLYRSGEPIARASAFIDEQLRADGEPTGLIGMFESVDDEEAMQEILGAAMEWLREQGAAQVWAPVSFSIWVGYRFRTLGHDLPAYPMESTNPAYYPQRFEEFGFTPLKRYIQGPFDMASFRTGEEELRPAYDKLRARGYRFRASSRRLLVDEDFRRIHRLIVPCYRSMLAWTDISVEEFEFAVGGLRAIADPGLIYFAFDPEGNEVGFVMGLPDVGHALRQMKGNMTLGGKLRFLWHRRSAKRAIFCAHVATVESVRGTGMGNALVHLMHKSLRERGFDSVITGLAAEDNFSWVFTRGTKPDRQFTLYRATL
jgi:hypothetical protein